MIVTALVASVLTSCMYITLVGRFSKRSLYLMNGYSAFVDLLFTLFVIGISATTATTTALLISAFTGVILSVSLILLRRYLGYTKIERVNGSWFKYKFVNYAPTSKLPSWLAKVENLLPTVNKAYA